MSKNTVLVADELDKTDESSKKRSELIRKFGSDLSVRLNCMTDVLFVNRLSDLLGKKVFSPEQRHKMEAHDLQKYSGVLQDFKNPGRLFIKIGWPIDEIVKLVNKERYEGLVLGTRSVDGIERFFLGSVAEEVVRGIHRPAFVFGPGAQREQYSLANHENLNIVVLTDLTKRCRAAETYAISLAKRTGGKVVFYYSLAETLKVAQTFAYASGEALSVFSTDFDDIKKEAVTFIEKKVTRLKSRGFDCSYHIESENVDVAEGALSYAGNQFQLFVMGAQSHGFIGSTVLGSSVREMIRQAKVPVVVVR